MLCLSQAYINCVFLNTKQEKCNVASLIKNNELFFVILVSTYAKGYIINHTKVENSPRLKIIVKSTKIFQPLNDRIRIIVL